MPQKPMSAGSKIIAYKSILYGTALFFLGIMQVTFFSKINLLSAAPDILLGAVITLSMLEDQRVSAISGIVSGVIYCALGTSSLPMYILFSFLCGYFFHSISNHLFGKNFFSFLALALIAYGAKALFNITELSFLAQSFNLASAVISVIIPEFISSAAFCSISYFVFSGLTKIFNKKHN